ncbi:MAG TPA: hypothetical protein DDW41_01075 [Candidatus Andersenbacteria bacterium]|nr:MAG: hypothetical protein UW94_C0011G0034 [Parcubacteria group bacterium GW2011_GWA2_45_14]HBE89776.1 hypothetical protein [Candidatus Andersenbacteria bacterium]
MGYTGNMSVHKARMKIKYDPPTRYVRSSLHWGTICVLLGLLVAGGIRYLTTSQRAGALDFTTHLLSGDTSAVGVLSVEATDIDDDGDIDAITCGKDGLKVYKQLTGVTFEAKLIDDKACERVIVADLDKDGASDLLLTMWGRQPSVRWYRNTGNVEFSGTNIGTGSDGKAAVGDVDGDGALDVVTATTQGSLVVLERWMNNGSGSFTSTQLSADSGIQAIAIGDVDGNGFRDVVTSGSQGLQRWHTSDGLAFSRIDLDDSHTGQRHLAIGDINNDNKTDIVAAEPGGNQVIYYRNIDKWAFQRIDIGSDIDATTVQIVDLDEDGDMDVLAAAQDNNLIAWFDNDGSDSFTKRTLAEGLQSIFGVKAVDVDNDNDFDVIGGNHMRGTVYWFERVAAKPVATEPGSITQSTDGKGIITFTTTVSDGDYDATRIRVQYSLDGVNWYKPWLTSASPSAGAVNLKNSHGYQVGTTNAIDTNGNSEVTVTMKWDTKSAENTGGPVTGEQESVRLRIIPRDAVGNGETVDSDVFEIDNRGPLTTGMTVKQLASDLADLEWGKITDNSGAEFQIYYGSDAAKVLSKDSEVWDGSDDTALSEMSATGTTITDLAADTLYTFKLVLKDAFGNEASLSSVTGRTTKDGTSLVVTPGVSPNTTPAATVSAEPLPETTILPSTEPTLMPTATLTASPVVTIRPTVSLTPEIEETNLPPQADAGDDLVVNNGELVILDGTASRDPEGASLIYNWRQVVGKPVSLSSSNTATPSFTAKHDDDSYVFALTVRDLGGRVATDSVTIVTRLPLVQTIKKQNVEPTQTTNNIPFIVSGLLAPANYLLLFLAFCVTGVAIQGRIPHVLKFNIKQLIRRKTVQKTMSEMHVLRVLDSQNGRRLANVKLQVKGMDDKVWGKAETTENGEAALQLPVGRYRVELRGGAYSFAQAGLQIPVQSGEVVYTGGSLQVNRQDEPMTILVPLKRVVDEVLSWRMKLLKSWQFIQRRSHFLAWPVYIGGAGLNTTLLLWVAQLQFLIIEVIYIALVFIKVWIEMRQTPSYGVVRDAISRVPLDLAVVRLYEEKTGKLVLTRATNGQGKFFALPPSGTYTVTVTKPGYATFTRHDVMVNREQSGALQIQTDLMPVVPIARPFMAAA